MTGDPRDFANNYIEHGNLPTHCQACGQKLSVASTVTITGMELEVTEDKRLDEIIVLLKSIDEHLEKTAK